MEAQLLRAGSVLTNAQAALLAATSYRLSGISDDQDCRMALDRADIFKRWLDDHDAAEEQADD